LISVKIINVFTKNMGERKLKERRFGKRTVEMPPLKQI
jgi:hypothetical protein